MSATMGGAVLGSMTATLGMLLVWRGLLPAHEPITRAIARLDAHHHRTATNEHAVASDGRERVARDRVASALVQHRAISPVWERIDADLRLLGLAPAAVATQTVVFALIGFFWAPAVAGGALLLGMHVPPAIPVWLAVAGATVAILLPYRQVRAEARRAREAFMHALSCYCDIAGMAMSAGHETYAALFDAANAGDGPAFQLLRDALQVGYLADDPPWESLQQLGHAIGVVDLVELGATLALAGNEGAAVRETVASRARTMRERLIADTERQAQAATERMAIPGAMLLIGFLWFLTFPALFLILQQTP